MRTGVADDGTAQRDATYRKAYDLLAEGFGRGVNGPLTVVVDGASETTTARVQQALSTTGGIVFVSSPVVSPAGDTAVLTAIPAASPQDQATETLVHHLRDDVLPQALQGTGATSYVTGQTAAFIDISERLSARLPLFIIAVVGLSFLLLMIVFRSVLVPLKAAVMNLLSIGAAYGVVVAVFQWGWGIEPDRSPRHRPDQPVPPDDHVRHPVRAVDGLRGVPALPGPGGVRAHRRQPSQRGRRPGRHGPGHHLGRPHHDQRLRLASC